MLIGSCVWAYIISAGCGIIATLNPQGVEFRQTMDELNYFSRDKNLPQALTIKLRTFFQNTQHIIFARQYDGLLEKMSPLLRGEAALRVASKSIARLPYFRSHEVRVEGGGRACPRARARCPCARARARTRACAPLLTRSAPRAPSRRP